MLDAASALTPPAAEVVHIEAPGARLAYRIHGKGGAPVLLLAGGPGFSGSYLEAMARRLEGGNLVVVPDQRGTGDSVATDAASTGSLSRLVADLELVRTRLGVEKIALVGHSWGGTLAMMYASEHPERVARLVLVAPGGPHSGYVPRWFANVRSRLGPSELDAMAFWSAPERFSKDPGRAVRELNRAMAPAMFFDRGQLWHVMADTLTEKAYNPQVTLDLQASLAGYDLREGLSRLAAPTLVLYGRQDPLGEQTAFEVREAIRGSRLAFLEECGHWPFLEQSDKFYAEVEPFLTRP